MNKIKTTPLDLFPDIFSEKKCETIRKISRTIKDDKRELVICNPRILKIGSALMLMCSILIQFDQIINR